jgi:hypothetical protein
MQFVRRDDSAAANPLCGTRAGYLNVTRAAASLDLFLGAFTAAKNLALH